jgi:hypothetical protein
LLGFTTLHDSIYLSRTSRSSFRLSRLASCTLVFVYCRNLDGGGGGADVSSMTTPSTIVIDETEGRRCLRACPPLALRLPFLEGDDHHGSAAAGL